MTVRGGGIPRRPLALTPNGRMGPPLRSFAADAHDCIMVRVLGPTGYKVVARLNRAPKAGSPLIVIATALSVPSCSKPSRYGLARAKHAARLVRRPILTASDLSDARVGMKKRTLRSNQETDEGKRCAQCPCPPRHDSIGVAVPSTPKEQRLDEVVSIPHRERSRFSKAHDRGLGAQATDRPVAAHAGGHCPGWRCFASGTMNEGR
jgi:hypothetical protein